MHGDVGSPVEHRLLHFLREHASPADGVQVRDLVAIAGRRDEHVLDIAPDQCSHTLGLPAREPAGARGDANHCSVDGRSKRAVI